jgi:TRAP-type C4-dicarboxylate transport system substrate-binding protein
MFHKLVTTGLAVLALVCAADRASATTIVKVGTLAPGDSPWGKEFKRWGNEVSKDTNGEVELDFQWNGQAGDEVLMVQKIRAGQLDGAGVSSLGLAQTGVTDTLIFNAPGLFSTWSKLDSVRDALRSDLDTEFEAKGFRVIGWADAGAAKTMTVDLEVQLPTELRGKGVFFTSGDPITPKIYSTIGGITPKLINIGEVMPSLANGSINVVTISPLAVEQLQWASRITDVCTQTISFLVGGLLVSSQRLQSLSPSARESLVKRGAEMTERLTKSIRNMDAQSFARLKSTKKVYDWNDDSRKAWQDVFHRVNQQLRGTLVSSALYDRVTQLAGQ